jgi:hypothetical protein
MLIQGQVAQAIAAARASGQPNALLAQLGELGVSEILPRFGATAWSGLLFFAANTAVQALSVASTTFTGLGVANPAGSGKNLLLIDALVGVATAPTATGAIKLGSAATVALTTGNSTGPKGSPVLLGSSGNSVANVGASATLGAAPTTVRPLGGLPWSTGAGFAGVIFKDEIGGAVIVPPGQMVTIDAFTTAISVIASMTWLELPI